MIKLEEFKKHTKNYTYFYKILYIYENYYKYWDIFDYKKMRKKYIKIDNLIYKKPLRLFKKEIDLINRYHKNKIDYNYKVSTFCEALSLLKNIFAFNHEDGKVLKKLKGRICNHNKLKFDNFIYFSEKDLKALNEFVRILKEAI